MAGEDDDFDTGTQDENTSQPDPMEELASRFEGRLNQIAGAVQTLANDQKATRQRDADSRVRGQITQLDQAVRSGDAAVTAAERSLTAAIEAGEAATIARAQRVLSEQISNRDRIKIQKADFERASRAAAARQQQPAKTTPAAGDDTNLKQWKSRHASWYGVDNEMTKAAHAIDNQIRATGAISIGSQEYFRAIDQQMAQKYPQTFKKVPETSGAGGGRGGNPSSNAARGRIPQSVVDGWERMGIDVKDPKVIERMLKNRQEAVDKGILPQEMVRERVRA